MDAAQSAPFRDVWDAYHIILGKSPDIDPFVSKTACELIQESRERLTFEVAKTRLYAFSLTLLRQNLMATSQREASTELTPQKRQEVLINLTAALDEAEKEPDYTRNSLYKVHLIFTLSAFANDPSSQTPLSSAWNRRMSIMNLLEFEPSEVALARTRESINKKILSKQASPSA